MTYSRSETNNAWNIPFEVMKFVYLHPTYVLFVLVIGLNITCTNSIFCEYALDFILSVYSLNSKRDSR